MKGINSADLILLHPSLQKSNSNASSPPSSPLSILGTHHRLWLIVFLSFFTFASLLTLLSTTHSPTLPSSFTTITFPSSSSSSSSPSSSLPPPVFDALLHYASFSNSTTRMPDADLRAIAAVLRRRAPCNFLVFGLGAESPLWRALNHGGRTVFIDENEYYTAYLELRHPGLEAYDVSYTTKIRDLDTLLAAARRSRATECRPVQNLLFSDCRLAINDLPNHLYDVEWDVVLVDGPRGTGKGSPGRMASIFSAAVMARWKGEGPTDVLVHDYEHEVQRVCSQEFLCLENRVIVPGTTTLAHFIVRRDGAARRDEFCATATATNGTNANADAVAVAGANATASS